MSVVCQAVLVVDEVFAQSQKMLAKSPHAINIHRPLGAYGSIGSLVYDLDPTVVSPAAKSIGGKHPIEGFRMIGHGDTVFRTLLGLSQAALRWLPSRCRKTSVSRQGAIQPIGHRRSVSAVAQKASSCKRVYDSMREK
jgi:hypothetical protein